tara:strand:+ start:151 stop:498 length:348 start_codon:yes stop_codon:yes gene_type:complete
MKSNILTAAVVVGVIALIVIAYQGLIVVPQNQIEAQAAQAEAERMLEVAKGIDRQNNYDSCISSAYSVYSANWDNQCELAGKEIDCSLSLYENADVINTQHQVAEDTCLAIFKAS